MSREPPWKKKAPGRRRRHEVAPRAAKTIDIIEGRAQCPLPLSVIPNYMGINLCSVEAVSWEEREDGQLVSLTIHFIPEEKGG